MADYILHLLFIDCAAIKEINFLGAVTRIGYMAFKGCTSLTSITIPSSVKALGDNTFQGIYFFHFEYSYNYFNDNY